MDSPSGSWSHSASEMTSQAATASASTIGSDVGSGQGFAIGFQKGVRVGSDLGYQIGFNEGYAEMKMKLGGIKSENQKKAANRIISLARDEIKLNTEDPKLVTQISLIQKLGSQLRQSSSRTPVPAQSYDF